MNTYFETATTSPDELTIEAERKDLLLQIESMRKEIDRLNGELSHMRSDNDALKEELKYPVIADYPKGDSKHYDVQNPVPVIDANKIIERTQNNDHLH